MVKMQTKPFVVVWCEMQHLREACQLRIVLSVGDGNQTSEVFNASKSYTMLTQGYYIE